MKYLFAFLVSNLIFSSAMEAQDTSYQQDSQVIEQTAPDLFEMTLNWSSFDTEFSQIVFRSYKKYLATLVTPQSKSEQKLKDYIIDHLFQLSTLAYVLELPLWEYSELNVGHRNALQKAFTNFRTQVVEEVKFWQTEPSNFDQEDTKKRIVIVTGPYNGGHISPAKALKEELNGDFDVEIVDDIETLCKELKNHGFDGDICQYNGSNLIMNGGGSFPYFDLYSPFYPVYFDSRFHKMFLNSYGLVRKKLMELKPNLIISTLHHMPNLVTAAHNLNIPIATVVTDFGLPPMQWGHLNHGKYPYLSIWSPTKNNNFFRRMIRSAELQGAQYNWTANAISYLIKQHIFYEKKELTDLLPELETLRLTGFPVAKSFEKELTEQEKIDVKRRLKMNLDPHRKSVALSYGAGVVATLIESFLESLLAGQDALNQPVQLIILTGRNQKLYHELESFLAWKNVPVINADNYEETREKIFDEKIIVRVLPMLAYPNDIADFYKVIDLLLSKAGGATSAEIVATQTHYLRAFGLTGWELENIKYLEAVGLTIPSKKFSSKENPLEEDLTFYLTPPENDEFFESLNSMLSKSVQIKKDKIVYFDRKYLKSLVHKMIEQHSRTTP